MMRASLERWSSDYPVLGFNSSCRGDATELLEVLVVSVVDVILRTW